MKENRRVALFELSVSAVRSRYQTASRCIKCWKGCEDF